MKALVISVALLSTLISAGAAQAKAVKYEIDNDHTHIVWQVDRFGFAKTIGTFADITGTLMLDEAAPQTSSVEASITLAGLRSDMAQREDIVRGGFWLDAGNYPTITFTSTKVTITNAEGDAQKTARVEGLMTLKGVSAPLVMDVKLNKMAVDRVTKKEAAGFSAFGSFDRADFGVRTAIGPVGANVSFQIEVLAIASE